METITEILNARAEASALLMLVKTVLEDDSGAYSKILKDVAEYARTFAETSDTPPEILEKLAEDEDWRVRENVAANPSTPRETLEKLAEDINMVVRENVAANPNTPSKTLEKLAKDTNIVVRGNVANNPITPASVLIELANDSYGKVRLICAENPNTPVEALVKLAEDKLVALTALNHANMTTEGCAALEGKVDSSLIKYKLHCIMMQDMFQTTYSFDYFGNIYLLDDGCWKLIENIADAV